MPPLIRKTLLATAGLSILGMALPALQAARADTSADAATTKPATAGWGDFGIQTQWIDPKVKPGDDFDAYVNGKWEEQAKFPADKTRIGSFIDLRDLSDERVHGILDNLVASNPAPGTDAARIANDYEAFMDTDAIDKAGLAPAKPYLDAIYNAKSKQDLMRLFGEPGYASPVEAFVMADMKDSDHYALYAELGGLGLPDRDYYLKDTAKFKEARTKYVEYLQFLFKQLDYKDPEGAASAVMGLETQMAKYNWDRAASRDRDLIYNKMSMADFDKLGDPGLLKTMFDTLGVKGTDSVIAVEIPPTEAEIKKAGLTPAEAAEKLSGGLPATIKLIESAPLETWQAYLAVHFLVDHASVLPSAIDDATFDFYGKTLSGQEKQRPRWKRGVSAVQDQIGELLGKIYAEKYYPPAEKAAMTDLVANLRKAMAANLKDLKWMTPATRKEALAKLDAFTPKIGAPAKFKEYEGLMPSATDPLGNSLAASKWSIDYDINRIGKPVDRAEWHMLPQTVNAYYNSTMNEIVFPAAILQPPFFNLTADPAVNYGAIGAVIGHEMGHGFDDQGAKSDGKGNLRDWWQPADKANFKKMQDKLAAQYDQFCPFDDGKTCVNGKLTMGENIGDLGGISVAYRAYHMSLNGKPAPVIDGYTGDQRFFMAYAQVWRSKVREDQARQYLVTDPHSPPQYRVNGIVRNINEWYKAFNVKPDDKLYLPPDQRVRIW